MHIWHSTRSILSRAYLKLFPGLLRFNGPSIDAKQALRTS